MEDTMEENQDPLRYDKLLLTQLRHVSGLVTNFAITNYAASGAIFFAFFTTKLPSWVILVAIIVINCNFVLAIAHNIWVARRLHQMHTIARMAWFENKTKDDLHQSLKKDALSSIMLTIKSTELGRNFDFSHPAVASNLIPALGAIGLLVMDLLGVSLR
jgi:hypothetical protein